ncbi:MAG: ComF family protein [Thermodesulfovibrionales bacterium]|nr:ComF family protein [Thermodesulfovibrionales bacterium]
MQKGIKDRLTTGILNLLYPSLCPVCAGPTDNLIYSPICRACWNGMTRYDGPSCGICAAPLGSEHASVCTGCMKNRPGFTKAVSFGLYSGALREAVHLLKFSGLKRLAAPLGGLLLGVDMPEADCIVPVPLEIIGLRARGFNQTFLIGRQISKGRRIPLLAGALFKRRKTLPQVGLSAEERALNLKGAFGVRGRLHGKRVLLLDDVMTTGATARECTRELLNAGAEEVAVAVLARA